MKPRMWCSHLKFTDLPWFRIKHVMKSNSMLETTQLENNANIKNNINIISCLILNFFSGRIVHGSDASSAWLIPSHRDYIRIPQIKNSHQVLSVFWSLIRKCLFSSLLFYNWGITKTLIMQHALMHKRLQRLTHSNIPITPEEERPGGGGGGVGGYSEPHVCKTRDKKNT